MSNGFPAKWPTNGVVDDGGARESNVAAARWELQ
jgi:hypothetical protein